MTKELLDGADVVAIFKKVCGEGVAERVAGGTLGQCGFADRPFDRVLEIVFEDMVASDKAGAWLHGSFCGWKGVLPAPLSGRGGVFAFEDVGQVDGAVAVRKILPVQCAGDIELSL